MTSSSSSQSSEKRRRQRITAKANARARAAHAPGVLGWWMLSGDECWDCGVGLEPSMGSWDHVIALDRGGTNYLTNIVRCCYDCQRSKFTKTPAELEEYRDLVVTCANPDCGVQFKPRWAECKRGMARFHSHACAGAAKGKDWAR